MNNNIKNNVEFDINELIISWLISALLIIGIINLKTSYELNKQQNKTLEAMEVAVQLDNEKIKLSKEKNDLGTIIILQKNWYQNEIKKREKYENIIKDIDRTWTEQSK